VGWLVSVFLADRAQRLNERPKMGKQNASASDCKWVEAALVAERKPLKGLNVH